jgi:hypothetical protein
MGEALSLSSVDDGSLDEIRLRGTFNVPDYGTQLPDILADARRALQPGGKLHIHVLTADRPLADDALSLPGPASRVKHVPVDKDLLSALEEAQFANVTLTTFRSSPCFRIGAVELRETMVVCHKPVADLCGAERVVVYKGPFAQVTDAEHTFRRGERTTIPLAAWETLERSPLGSQFVCFEAKTDSTAVCGVH